jgi:hypothetical protein
VELASKVGTITLPGNMLAGTPAENSDEVSVTIGEGDTSQLSSELRDTIGDRPVVELELRSDGETVEWENPQGPVRVSIPYTPTDHELQDPEHIVVWYIDGSGQAVPVPSGRYNPETGTVTFTTTHFSSYALAYVHKTFADLEGFSWAEDEIEVLASRDIIKGIGQGLFLPEVDVSRADYLVMLVRTLGLEAAVTENFADVDTSTYYYEPVGVAKALGIVKGRGSNLFEPQASITRQDMMVMTSRALTMLDQLPQESSTVVLEQFADDSLVAGYAVDSVATLVSEQLIEGAGGKLNPLDNTTRAEAAVFLYRVYNH